MRIVLKTLLKRDRIYCYQYLLQSQKITVPKETSQQFVSTSIRNKGFPDNFCWGKELFTMAMMQLHYIQH